MPWWWYFVPLAAIAVVSAALSWRVSRARYWIGLTALSFVSSVLWWMAGGIHPAAFGAATNFIVVGLMLPRASQKWEFYVINVFGFMILVDVLWQFGAIPSRFLFAVTLEMANYAVLVGIAGIGILDRIPADDRLPFGRRNSGWSGLAYRHLVKEKRYPRWWREE